MENNAEIVNQIETHGALFINIYNDGEIEVENRNGGRVKADGEAWVFAIRELMGLLRTPRR